MRSILAVYKRALRILWQEKSTANLLLLAGIITAVIQMFEPILFGRVIDTLTQKRNVENVLWLWFGLGATNVMVSVALAVFADRLAHRRRLTLMGEVFDRVIKRPASFHASRGSGLVVRSMLVGTDQLFALWLSFLREHLSGLVGILVLIPAAIHMDWRLASLLFGLAILYLLGNNFILQKTHGGQAHVEMYHQDLFGRVGDVIGNVMVVQSYTRLVNESAALQEIISRVLRVQYPVLTWWGLLTVVTRAAATLTMVAILALGSVLSQRNEISVGEIVAFIGFSGILIAKLDQLSSFVSRTLTQAPSLATFFELLDSNDAPVERVGAVNLMNVRGDVEFDQVSYQYPQKSQGVNDISFTVPAGQTVALVGASGSGKTTSLALIQRLYDPQQGRILIDGCDVKDCSLASLRQNIAVVFQEAGLFNRSIAENIRVGRPEASDAEVEKAAHLAEAHEFIVKKPGGYSFVIGERGANLSGGERQRIAIARALLKQAPILIFDEATSALDNQTERNIQGAMATLRQGKTTFVIAHRLSTVVNADLILVFDNGRIVERGKMRELKLQNGRFAELLRAGELKDLV